MLSGEELSLIVLDDDDLRRLLSFETVLRLVERTLGEEESGCVHPFRMVRERLANGARFGIRSAHLVSHDTVGVKVSGYFPANELLQRDKHQATVLLLDPRHGAPRAVMSGNYLTWIRTAAVGGLGTLLLAPADARRVLILGAGQQARAQIFGHTRLLADREVELATCPSRTSVETSARRLVDEMMEEGVSLRYFDSVGDGLAWADVAVTVTPSEIPLITARNLGTVRHISALGSDAPGKRELGCELIEQAFVAVDDVEQSTLYGELQDGAAPRRLATIGAVLTGQDKGRQSSDELTIFDSTGYGPHDVAIAVASLMAAERAGRGTEGDLV